MATKRLNSILIPIKKSENGISIFMQKRGADMERLPNYFGFWGGGCETDETPEQGLLREIKEELGIELDLEKVKFFGHYESFNTIKNIYLMTVEDGWSNRLEIGEGEYGKWFDITEEMFTRNDIILQDKAILNDLERQFLNKPIR